MAIDKIERAVVTQEPTITGGPVLIPTAGRRVTGRMPGDSEMTRGTVVLAFGLVQIVIGARFVLLLLNAREANGLVSGILSVSQMFVGPFEGILRTDSLTAAGAVLDVSAIMALVGWTVIELVAIWAIGIFRREPA